ncbi:diguanylate cyclase [Alteromonas aestuariivivens]|uniref:diguanylate cyclase n=1 Tax=Alteromonas aestuariivivens TaxID=1938339 RepID=A0A3D8M7F1_9ALTE|nr:response regulator [Alteromonas aestuariivivens]RDV25519.1 diguanylate cyclase [Alteromonas aestuariivivens]
MQRKVLVIEDSSTSLKLVSKLVRKAGLQPVGARSLTEARVRFADSTPEEYLCAVVDYHLPDAPHGEAIDFAVESYLPTIVVTGQVNEETRAAVWARPVVDYIPKENAQVYDYLSRLMARLQKNKFIGILVVNPNRSQRNQVTSLLNRHNFLTYEASHGSEALDKLTAHPHIQVVICSDKLPDVAATEFVARLRKEYSRGELSIMVLANDNSDLLPARFIKSGATDFLRNPFCYEEFLCRVTMLIELLERVADIRRAANTDYLTGLPNRRHFFYILNHQYRNLPTKQALALLDLDYFKRVNDRYGHDSGDAVLKSVASLLASEFADVFVARLGGEEFCIYLPGFSAEEAFRRLERFRQKVEHTRIENNGDVISITTSIGLTTRPANNIEALLSFADSLLYQAKNDGRNQVCSDMPVAAEV